MITGRRIEGGHGVALCIVEAQYRQLGEIEPTIVEELEPIIDRAINCHDEVELSAKGIQLEPKVDVLGGECGLIVMKRVSPLVGKHQLVDNGIKHDCEPTNANRDQRARGERHACAAGSRRVRHLEEDQR